MTEFFKEFQEFRQILCVCPCCGDIVRISDLKLKIKGVQGKTWRDTYDRKLLDLQRQVEKFEEIEEGLREEAKEKGRKAAQEVFNNAISPTLKKLNYDPFDIKPVFFPIDFLVFKGMNRKQSLDNIILLSKNSENNILNSLRESVETAVLEKNYEWQEARINENGVVSFK
jgi:predicted Holliday junction resolvase-like endonuclease